MDVPDLAERDVHVWFALLDGAPAVGTVLSDSERDRAARFRSPLHGARWAAAHAFLRLVLGGYTGLDPAGLVFDENPDGKPMLSADTGHAIRFNLSHARDVALMAVSAGADVGVDIEAIDDDRDLTAVAQRVLPVAVAAAVAEATSPSERVARFFPAWTRHEARLKCKGTGVVEPDEDDGGGAEYLVDLDIGRGYAAALAVSIRPARLLRLDWDWHL